MLNVPNSTPEQADRPINTPDELKSYVRNILRATPEFSIFYEQALQAEGLNPNQIKILAERYRKNFMSTSNVRTCTHIKVSGVRCGSPALRGEQFCYFHQRMLRGVKTPPRARLHPIANLEDGDAIQASLMEIINALLHDRIEVKRAELILRALHIAVRNAHNVRFNTAGFNSVKQIPDYAEPAPKSDETAVELPLTSTLCMPREMTPHEKDRLAKADAEHARQVEIRESLARAAKNSGLWNAKLPPAPSTPTKKPPLGVKAEPNEQKKSQRAPAG